MQRRAHLVGWGAYVPRRVLSNADLGADLGTSDAWIVQRTGIRSRHIAAPGEGSTTMAVRAAEAALTRAGVPAGTIDLIVVATNTPDTLVPNTACRLQRALGAGHAVAFDVNSACTGFVYALVVADALVTTGPFRRALVVGADTMSRVVDWTDRTTCVLFGDGAGAIVLEASRRPGGVRGTHLGTDGSNGNLISLPIGLAQLDADGPGTVAPARVRMAGRDVFAFAVRALVDATRRLCADAGLAVADIDLLIAHQANERILDSAAQRLGLRPEQVFSCVAEHGNTCAASVPLALDTAVTAGRVRPGALVALVGFGGGLSWGGCLIEWTAQAAPIPLHPYEGVVTC